MRVETAFGEVVQLGTTEANPSIGIIDYSRRVTDEFGVTTIVERGFSRRLSTRFAMPFEGVDALQRKLAELRASSARWVADDRFASLSVQGFYKDFSIDLNAPPLSYCSLTVEGVVEPGSAPEMAVDPAPDGRQSTLRVLAPLDVADAHLAYSSAAENDYPQWAAGTYAKGARVVRGHRVWESASADNTADPLAASGSWIDTGPTNRWAMFDQALGTATVGNGAVEVIFNPASVNAVAVLDAVGATARVRAPGYDRTIAIGPSGTALFLDLPLTSGAGNLNVTIAGGGQVRVGTLLIGRLAALGVTESSPTAEITDFSRKDVDDFGGVDIVERAWAKRMSAGAMIRTDAIDAVFDRLAAVRARASLWIGDTDLDSLTLYGFFKDFSIEVGPSVSKLSLSVEGLSKAASIAGPVRDAVTVYRNATARPQAPTTGSRSPADWNAIPQMLGNGELRWSSTGLFEGRAQIGDWSTPIVVGSLVDRGTYDPDVVYELGDTAKLPNGSRWRFMSESPVAGSEPDEDNPDWLQIEGPTAYADGTPIDVLKPAQPGATNDTGGADERDVDHPPSYYRANWLRRLRTEFKQASALGAPAAGAGQGALETYASWGDPSGGPVWQRFTNEAGVRSIRTSLTEQTWDAWKPEYSGYRPPAFGGDITETIGGVLALLANFKTAMGNAAGFQGQGSLATLSQLVFGGPHLSGFGSIAGLESLGYGSPYLTGFGSLSPLDTLFFGSPLFLEGPGGIAATLAAFKTALGNAAGFDGQGQLATLNSLALGSGYLTGFGSIAGLSQLAFGGPNLTGFGSLAGLTNIAFGGPHLLDPQTGIAATLAAFKTILGNSAGFQGQGSLATKNIIAAEGDLGGNLAFRLAPHPLNAGFLASTTIAYAEGVGIELLKPQEGGANVTEARTASAVAGQGALATKNVIAAEGDLGGNLAYRLAPHPLNPGFLSTTTVAYEAGQGVELLKPQEIGSNKTETRTAAAFNGQGALATQGFVAYDTQVAGLPFAIQPASFFESGYLRASGVFANDGSRNLDTYMPTTTGADRTSGATASAVAGQGALATKNVIAAEGDLGGSLATRLAPHPVNPDFLSANTMAYAGGVGVELLKPQEAGSNKTETRVASAVAGQGALATAPTIAAWNVAQYFNFSAFQLNYSITRADGASILTESLAITSLGISGGFAGQGLLATKNQAGAGDIAPSAVQLVTYQVLQSAVLCPVGN